MRILRIAQNLYPEVPGGGTYHVHALSRDQADMGHDVTVLTVSGDEALPRRETRDGYTVVRARPTVEILGNQISSGVVRFLRNASGFDIVHTHSHLYFATNLAALNRRFTDVPLGITNHGLYSQTAPEWLFDQYLRTLGRWTFNQSDSIFCYTQTDRERLRDFGVTAPVKVVPNGVDTERFSPDGPQTQRIDHGGNVVLFVGRLVEGKRAADAIKAVSRVPDSLNTKLFIVGDGPLRQELEAMPEASEVEFLGQIPYDEMPSVFRAGDALLLPSRAEGFPRTVLEAFASAVPVVSSHLAHTAGVVEVGGRTAAVGDISGYVEGLVNVLGNQSRLGEAGRDLVVDRFTWEETVRKTTAVLESLV